MNNIRKSCKVLVLILISLFLCLLIINYIIQLVKKEFIQILRFVLIFNLIIYFKSYCLKI